MALSIKEKDTTVGQISKRKEESLARKKLSEMDEPYKKKDEAVRKRLSEIRRRTLATQDIAQVVEDIPSTDESHYDFFNIHPVPKTIDFDLGFDPLEVESCICSEDLEIAALKRDPGVIDISFPENKKSELIGKLCLPASYYTLSGKERLILHCAENFRRQFQINYPDRRPLVLAVKNECDVQKFVSTTIKPTAFLYPDLISSWEGCAKFVADFIYYERLPNAVSIPSRLVSPDTLLRTRQGNSFEMATLLASMLIGAGYPALVVSGTARRDVTVNDQREVDCPFVPNDGDDPENEQKDLETKKSQDKTSTRNNKYVLEGFPDLRSHLDENLAEIYLKRELERQRIQEEEEKRLQEENDMKAEDKYFLQRSHAWVVIIESAPWSARKLLKKFNKNSEESFFTMDDVFFIEPSTGFRHGTDFRGYLTIESMWNHYNYYVNRQTSRIKNMRWDVTNLEDWEHFLPGEPFDVRVLAEHSDENILEIDRRQILSERHLDLIPSWVRKLHIDPKQYEGRFPKLKKVVHYKRVIHERFSSYSERDGKETQITLFADDFYLQPHIRWIFYKNRVDCLQKVKIFYESGQVEESFLKGRDDKLKLYVYNSDARKRKFLHFYHTARFDALKLIEIHEGRKVFHYGSRLDFCSYQEFNMDVNDIELEEAIEKFSRNSELPPNKDIAMRHFLFLADKIFLQFHYAKGAITASTREFRKPPRPDYGQEIVYDPSLTRGYIANPHEPPPSPVELYFLMLNQLKAEKRIKKDYEKKVNEINELLELRKEEISLPRLKFSMFDPLRNQGVRNMRMKEFEQEQNLKRMIQINEPDFLAPYLITYANRTLTTEESWSVYNTCLNNLRIRDVSLLNELQKKYEDLTNESEALNKFLFKFHRQFEGPDYERLVKEQKELEVNKRMVQQRIQRTHEEAQKKYDRVKQSLLEDRRLNLDGKNPHEEGDKQTED